MSKKPTTIWKSTAQAAVLGMAGAAAMFATEMLLFPAVVHAVEINVDASCVAGCMTDLRTCLADARSGFVDFAPARFCPRALVSAFGSNASRALANSRSSAADTVPFCCSMA